jgi:hypothetical protein
MVRRLFVVIAVVSGFLLSLGASFLLQAQSPARTLTMIYSNNINAEVDPCPT